MRTKTRTRDSHASDLACRLDSRCLVIVELNLRLTRWLILRTLYPIFALNIFDFRAETLGAKHDRYSIAMKWR